MKPNPVLKKLSRFIATILGCCPDEFGLVTDDQGFVKIKDLLKAITEEQGWRHVRQAHLNEVLLSLRSPDFEIVDKKIRAIDRSRLPGTTRPVDLPKYLYTCVRRRAYPHVLNKGLSAGTDSRILLSVEKSMAERIGRRRDQHPVLITVQVDSSLENGSVYDRYGTFLYLADYIPAGCLVGPPLPKEKRTAEKEKPAPQRAVPTDAGTFRVDSSRLESPGRTAPKEKKPSRGRDADWKRERRQQKKHRQKW